MTRRTTSELTKQAYANLPPLNHNQKIVFYFRALKNLKSNADSECGRDDETAYMHYKRYVKVFTEVVQKHRDFTSSDAEFKKEANANCKKCLEKAEELHKKLQSDTEKAEVRLPVTPGVLPGAAVSDSELERRLRALMGPGEMTIPEPVIVPPPAQPEPIAPPMDIIDSSPPIQAPTTVSPGAVIVSPGAQRPGYPVTGIPMDRLADMSPYSSVPRPGAVQPMRQPGPPPNYGYMPSPLPIMKTATVVPPPPPPVFDREHQMMPGIYPQMSAQNKGDFKRIIIFEGVLRAFMKVAEANNRLDIETCGLLCCRAEGDALVLDTCLVPQQKGTKDTCSTLCEEEQFDFLDKRQLMLAGWIHTHPTQPCFLSSVDLHTHFGYQTMLPEAIAIVVAPRSSPNYGVFTLAPDGLALLKNCDLGGFHSHPSRAIYEPNPLHVVMLAGDVQVFDQRRR